jgi:esterase/lipase
MRFLVKSLLFSLGVVLLAGCISERQLYEHPLYETSQSPFPKSNYGSFDEYQLSIEEWLKENRVFIQSKSDTELSYNVPFEVKPDGASNSKKGIIFVHGLGDSPWSFVDVANEFAAKGYLVRSVLLPGHGSRPGDLIPIDVKDWRKTVKNQVKIMQSEGVEVSLGGFSTGANLVTAYANNDPSIQALYLFSPAFKSDNDMDYLAPAGSLFVDWIFQGDPKNHTNTMKYNSVPLNGFAQYYWSSKEVQDALARKPFDRPAFLAVTEHDSVVNVKEVLSLFEDRFTHPNSRLIWFGERTETADSRVTHLETYLPERNISNFSHMSLLYREDNFYYGVNGEHKICRNSIEGSDYEACLNGEELWYSAWGHQETGKVHARLTYNPYFEQMIDSAMSITN